MVSARYLQWYCFPEHASRSQQLVDTGRQLHLDVRCMLDLLCGLLRMSALNPVITCIGFSSSIDFSDLVRCAVSVQHVPVTAICRVLTSRCLRSLKLPPVRGLPYAEANATR